MKPHLLKKSFLLYHVIIRPTKIMNWVDKNLADVRKFIFKIISKNFINKKWSPSQKDFVDFQRLKMTENHNFAIFKVLIYTSYAKQDWESNLRPRVDWFKMKLRPCQDHVYQLCVCLEHVCQDHVCQSPCLSRPCLSRPCLSRPCLSRPCLSRTC